jgi:2-keto-4-pentenoate hydratase
VALSEKRIKELADALARAEAERKPIEPLMEAHPDLTPEEAYAIQLDIVRRKLGQGDRVVGKKIGLTSQAMQQMLGVDQPDYGHLLGTMAVKAGGAVEINRLLQPKVEGEIAFVLKRDLPGPGVTVADVISATDYLSPALEIIDSRIRDWKITLSDTIADNASSALFVLGDSRTAVDQVNVSSVGMVLEKNGDVVSAGAGAAVLGHPAIAVAWLANKLSEFGIRLQAGEAILPGALSAAVAVARGDVVTARFDHLGSVSVKFL